MSQTNRLLPELRFPEFRESEEWKTNSLSKLAHSVKEKAKKLKPEDVLTLSGEHGLVRQTDYFGKKIAGSDLKRYLRIEQNDFVYNDRTTSAAKYGSLKRLTNYNLGAVSPIYKCFRFSKQEKPIFWEHYFDAGAHESGLSEFVNEGARAGRFNISVDTFLSISVCYPSEPEQQKIADCLGSLDDLIAAHSRKLAALQDHKKGLLQQLFPAEGETTPKLRFPGFDGEWEEHAISEIFDTATGGTPERKNGDYWGGDVPWITTSLVDFSIITSAEQFITKEGVKNSSAKIFATGTILIAMYGQGKTRGQVALLGIQAATNQACAAILPNDNTTPYFVFQNLSNRYNELRSLSNDGGQKNLSQGLIRGLPISLPKDIKEQQKIADCLSALDALITAESEQIAALKEHKKGLMQKLFPNPTHKK
jgi:type I restriction enzyme S subunit